MFDAIKDVNCLFLATARIFRRLGALMSKWFAHMNDTDQEENTDPRKDCIYWWEC